MLKNTEPKKEQKVFPQTPVEELLPAPNVVVSFRAEKTGLWVTRTPVRATA